MSQENVEAVREGLDAVNRRDRAAWLALCDPELENIPPRDWPESDPIQGGEPVFDFLAVQAQDAWEDADARFEYVELIDAGDDKVVGDMRGEVRGKASGASLAWRYWQVVTFRNGKVVRIEWFGERAEALEAVGAAGVAVSQENVEIVRSAFRRFNAGEREPSPELWHVDCEYISDPRDPDPATYRGLAAIARVFRSWVDAYPDLRVEPLEIRPSGHRVFVWMRFAGHGAESGVPIDMERGQACTVADAKIRRVEEYFDRADALEAVGLRE